MHANVLRGYVVAICQNRKTNIPHDLHYKLEFGFKYSFDSKDACISYFGFELHAFTEI